MTDETTTETTGAAPPRRPSFPIPSRKKASPATNGGDDEAPSFVDESPYNPFDGVPDAPVGIEITRLVATPPSAGAALCGPVPSTPEWKQVVQATWGGGTYVGVGANSRGKARRETFRLPGPSLPLVAEPEEDDDDWGQGQAPPWIQYPGQQPRGPWAPPPPGYPGYPPFPYPVQHQFPGQRQGGGHSAFSEQGRQQFETLQREATELKAEVKSERERAERQRDQAQTEIARLREQLADERRKAEGLQISSNFERQIAEQGRKFLEAQVQNPGKAPDQNRGMIEALKSQASLTSALIKGSLENKQSPTDMIKLVHAMQSQTGGSSLKELLGLVQIVAELKGGDAGDDTWSGSARRALEQVAPALVERLTQAIPAADPAENPQPAQITQQPTAAPGAQPAQPQQRSQPVKSVPWPKIVREVNSCYEHGNEPLLAASHFRAFYRGLDEWPPSDGIPGKDALLAILPTTSAKGLSQNMQPLLGFFAADTEDGKSIREFLAILADENGSSWVDQFLGHLAPPR